MSIAPLHRVVASDPFIGRVLAGRFKVVEHIGEGGMSRIYKAESTESGGETVAVKVLHGYLQKREEAVARFHREVKAVTKIGHPGIITVLESGTLSDGTVYMIQELLKGEDWGEVLERSGAQPIAHAVKVVRQVCDGLGAAHEKGIIHRDLKPANVFLHERKSGRIVVKLLDFGVSKIRDDDQSLTATDSTMGTVAYMSPEQLRGAKFVDVCSDIWALGVMLFEALAGHKPYEAETMAMTATKILKDATPRIRAVRPDVPAGLQKIIHKLLQKNPEKRFQTAAEVKEALTPYLSMETTAVTQDIIEEPMSKAVYIGAAAAVVLLVGALWFSFGSTENESDGLPELHAGTPRAEAQAEAQVEAQVEETEPAEVETEMVEPQAESEVTEPAEAETMEVVVETPMAEPTVMRAERSMRTWMRRRPPERMNKAPMMRTMVQISVMDF